MEFRKPGYVFRIGNDGRFELCSADGELIWIKSVRPPLLPMGNRGCIFGPPQVTANREGGCDIVTLAMPSAALYEHPRVRFKLHDDFIETWFEGQVRRRFALHKWYVLAQGSTLNAAQCIDFRSHINSPGAYDVHQVLLNRRKPGAFGLEATTDDSDLMFAPHPMLFVFENVAHSLLIGPMGLVNGESLQLKMVKGSTTIDDFHVRIGDSLYWLDEGETLASPHFMFTQTVNAEPYGVLRHYTGLLERERLVTPKTDADLRDWWLSPMWCSYGDQYAAGDLNEALVNRVVDVIRAHDLPIRTLILDDPWYTKQGDMFTDTARFPDLRGMVDRLHGMGFKVLCWASLYQFDNASEAYTKHPEWFLIHHYLKNVHNPERDWIHLDYSDPAVAGPYLGELMHRLLSTDKGGYAFDGIKFDWPFLLPHDYAYPNRDWVGKEKTVYNTQKLIYQAAKAVDPDRLIIGVSPHPFFNDTQDMIRTYDVATFDIRVNIERARYVQAIEPGMPVAMDGQPYFQNFFKYLQEGSRLGVLMIYNLLKFNEDQTTYTEQDYQRLREVLSEYVSRTPRLQRFLRSVSR
jgi:hypothetical protein